VHVDETLRGEKSQSVVDPWMALRILVNAGLFGSRVDDAAK